MIEGQPWLWSRRDPPSPRPVSCRAYLKWGNFPHHRVYHPWCWLESLPKQPWEKIPHSGMPLNPFFKRVLDSYPGLSSKTYKTEEEALKTETAHIEPSTHAPHSTVVLTDAVSILQAFSQIGSQTTTIYLLHLSPFVEAMQSPCSRFPSTVMFLAMRLLTLWQRREQQKSKWIGLPATLRWRPSSTPSNIASGGTSAHGTTRLTRTTC